jgi:hypothetical protein
MALRRVRSAPEFTEWHDAIRGIMSDVGAAAE